MPRRSKINLSHYKKFTAKMGVLYPVSWVETNPGDTWRHSTAGLLRFLPMLGAVMHPIQVRVYHFFVPYRLLWENWEQFITGGPDGNDQSEVPWVDPGTVQKSTLYDYLGIPPGTYTNRKLTAWPFRAYNFIWNEWFRDQDIQQELPFVTTSGQDSETYKLARVSWEKDYFTTARLTEQKGPSITIPIGERADVKGFGKQSATFSTSSVAVRESDGSTPTYASAAQVANIANGEHFVEENPARAGFPNVYADLSTATGITVNDLRLSLAIQRYQEARQQYGSRYVEFLRYIGIRNPSDARLQNPEFLGSARTMVNISEVLQTAADGDPATPVGTLRGHGITGIRGRAYRRFFEEHGLVMSLVAVVPKAVYSQAMPRAFFREIKEDFYQRELAYLGDQPVTNKEVYFPHSNPDGIFGYVPRYDEYRSTHSSIAGDFRDTLNFWHLARIHQQDIALNESFIECQPSDRIFAIQTGDNLKLTMAQRIVARRMMPANPKPRTF